MMNATKMIVARIDITTQKVRIELSDYPEFIVGELANMEAIWHAANEGFTVIVLPPVPRQ